MNILLYIIAGVLLAISFIKDKTKTKKALKKALKAVNNVLPQFLGVFVLVGITLAVFDADFISKYIGTNSGWLGVLGAAIIGSITLIPGLIAFPTASLLLDNGAGYMQIGAFVSALMMVGIVTLPVEIKYFNKKLAITRNILAFLFTFIVAFIIGKVANGIWF